MKVFLPYPPSANERLTRAKGRKGFVNTAKYRSWKEEAAWVVAMAIRDGEKKVKGHYRLDAVAMPPDLRPRDLDNLIKATSDAMKDGGAIEDDRFCQMVRIAWDVYGDLGPGILVEVQPCRNLLLSKAGNEKSPIWTEKPQSLPHSRRDATIPAAQTGDHSDTDSPAGKASASPHSSTSAESIACRSMKNNPKT
jgi:crossover junction endodeoxyribonuclease RusA